MAPTLRVVAPGQTLCVVWWVTQSITGGIPTRSVGTSITLARHMMFGIWPQAVCRLAGECGDPVTTDVD
ncbi:hypothetical protein ACI2KS_24560 [Pseudomonas sp. NPDC087358]|uniref:hypothetical protein n=1 Tax=Pseudomonas sp. NPDC087358 TaxID=3364439 RepID=UPI00384C798B